MNAYSVIIQPEVFNLKNNTAIVCVAIDNSEQCNDLASMKSFNC